MNNDVTILGGGAAGFFAAIACAETRPGTRVVLLERSARTLAKVAISGGGRCNVTHACDDPRDLVTNYPRGEQALRGAFTRFAPVDTVQWFADRGVELKTEADGRLFPTTNQSQTIIDCFERAAADARVSVQRNARVETITRDASGSFQLQFASGETNPTRKLILATGNSPTGWHYAERLGHGLLPPVPSLFTFNIKDPRLEGLSGVSVTAARVVLEGSNQEQSGPILITHWGLSGPAVLKLSAWQARALHTANYHMGLRVNWLGPPQKEVQSLLERARTQHPKKTVLSDNPTALPHRLWNRLVTTSGIGLELRWTECSNERLTALTNELTNGQFKILGKGVFKEEFVTCGGVRLEEIDFRTMESKKSPGLYCVGEMLDIDGVTGGFNFQSAWTTGWIAGQAAAKAL